MEVMACVFYGDYAMFRVDVDHAIWWWFYTWSFRLYSGQETYLSYIRNVNIGAAFGKVIANGWIIMWTWIMLWFKCVDTIDALVDYVD